MPIHFLQALIALNIVLLFFTLNMALNGRQRD